MSGIFLTSVSMRVIRSGRPSGMSMLRSGLVSMEPPSAGRTMVPVSSIQTAIGMLLKPNSSSVMCCVSEASAGRAASTGVVAELFGADNVERVQDHGRTVSVAPGHVLCQVGKIVRARCRVPMAGANGLTPWQEDVDELLQTTAHRTGDASHLHVSVGFDVLA